VPALRIASTLAFIGMFGCSLWLNCHPTKSPQKVDLLNLTSEAIALNQLARTDTDQFFQVGILVLGGLWTVAVVGKDTKIRRGDWWEIGSLTLTCLLPAARRESCLDRSPKDRSYGVTNSPTTALCARRTGSNSVVCGLTGTLGYPATYLGPLAALRRF
jgi:hypothetical protein